MFTILIIILILLLIGALPTWPYGSAWGYYPGYYRPAAGWVRGPAPAPRELFLCSVHCGIQNPGGAGD